MKDGDQPDVDILAQRLFDYEHADDELEPVGLAIAFGSHDEHVPVRAAELYRAGLCRQVLFTGGLGRITRHLWKEPEAARYARIVEELDVPADRILMEDRSTNTGDNIRLSRALMAERGLLGQRVIVVERPYRQVRTRATLEAQWPDLDFLMASPQLDYAGYCRFYEGEGPLTKEEFISLLVGDLQRILVYPDLGYQTPQEVPPAVLDAYRQLVVAGFTGQMVG